jgi:hypothetical protein
MFETRQKIDEARFGFISDGVLLFRSRYSTGVPSVQF